MSEAWFVLPLAEGEDDTVFILLISPCTMKQRLIFLGPNGISHVYLYDDKRQDMSIDFLWSACRAYDQLWLELDTLCTAWHSIIEVHPILSLESTFMHAIGEQ